MDNEIWKPIKDFEGYYEISNYGRVKSLGRIIDKKLNHKGYKKEKILKSRIVSSGYNEVILSKHGLKYRKSIHRTVFETFNKPLIKGKVIDHIDNNKQNNHIQNLQQVSYRVNNSKDVKNKSSKYTGVSWYKKLNKWQSCVRINGVLKHLGYFTNEIDACEAYKSAIKQLGLSWH